MRDFRRNRQDKEDAVEILKRSTVKEGYRFLTIKELNGYHAQTLAPALGIDIRNKLVGNLAKEVYEFVHDGIKLPQPEPDKPNPPVSTSKPCDGCGGIGDSPRFLRWAKAERGEPVTIRVNESGKPATLHWLTPQIILQEWYKPWEVDTCIRFKLIFRGKADISIGYGPIDGPGSTQGITWMPHQSIEFMEQGGDLSGNIRIDWAERWTSRERVHETGEHEGGHSIGMPHTDKPEDVLYAFARGFRRPHSLNDKRAKTARYPVKQEPIAA